VDHLHLRGSRLEETAYELHNVYASPVIVRVIKSRRMRWAGHVARVGEVTASSVLVGNLKGRFSSEDLCINSRII
jgi:hypothetical protein